MIRSLDINRRQLAIRRIHRGLSRLRWREHDGQAIPEASINISAGAVAAYAFMSFELGLIDCREYARLDRLVENAMLYAYGALEAQEEGHA